MSNGAENPVVFAVSKSQTHTFSKSEHDSITLLTGLGVEGDAHLGKTVMHRSRVRADPTKPNLRQVHLIHNELLDFLRARHFRVTPGIMGENITTSGIDLLALPRGTLLRIGASAAVRIEGLRNPCKQLDGYQQGLMDAVQERTQAGELIRKAGIMGTVSNGGVVKCGDRIDVVLPSEPHEKLSPV